MSDKQPDLFGTEAYKLHPKGGVETSESAAHQIDTAVWEQRVYAVIKGYGSYGCIQEEVLNDIHEKYGMAVSYSTITARFKALSEKGLIFYPGHKRKQTSNRQSMVRVATCFREDE